MDFPLLPARHAAIGIACSRPCGSLIDHPAPWLSAHSAPPEASRCAPRAPVTALAAGADPMRPDASVLHPIASIAMRCGENNVTFLGSVEIQVGYAGRATCGLTE
jgi:hypothetical protein